MTDNFAGQNVGQTYERDAADQDGTFACVLGVYSEYRNNPNVHIVNNYVGFRALGVDTPALYAQLLPDMVHPAASPAGYALMRANVTPALLDAARRVAAGPVASVPNPSPLLAAATGTKRRLQ